MLSAWQNFLHAVATCARILINLEDVLLHA